MKTINMKNVETSRPQNSVMSKFKITSVAAAVTTLLCVSLPSSYASDIEIYKVPEDSVGSTTLMMMLDTSGSMQWNMHNTTTASAGNSRLDILKKGLLDVLQGTATVPRVEDKIVMGLADFGGNTGRIILPAKPLGEEVSGIVSESYNKPLWYKYSNRQNRVTTTYYNQCEVHDTKNHDCLKWKGETTSSTGFPSNGYKRDTNQSCTYGNRGDCVYVWEEVKKTRNKTHRDEMVSKVNALKANGGTPTPYAYAEVAAYLLGTSPLSFISGVNNAPIWLNLTGSNSNFWTRCSELNSSKTNCASWNEGWVTTMPNLTGLTSKNCTNILANGNRWSGVCYYATGKVDSLSNIYSGFHQSSDMSKTSDRYIAPASITAQLGSDANAQAKKECSGQGIYFLTDGEPEPNGTVAGNRSGTAYELMSSALGSKKSDFNCANSELGKRVGYKNPANSWTCIGNFAQSLLDPHKNPAGLEIKTAVVGFSSGFNSDTNSDVQDAKDWGTIGGGGWYVGTNSQSVVDSINAFLVDINKGIPSMSTGSSTIPLDELNPAVVQPYAYFPQFEPKVDTKDSQQVWFGNLKKYHVINNGVYSSDKNPSNNTVVVKKSQLQDLADIWADGSISYPENHPVYRKHGALNRLILGTTTATNGQKQTGRKLLTDFVYDGTKPANERISKNLNLVQIQHTYTTDNKTKTDKIYAKALMGLLGYIISNDTESEGLDLSNQSPGLRQMGSIYHSKPLLLTQSGKAEAVRDPVTKKISVGSTNREDYVLFGTTQGLVQVVDAATGIEKFAFVPKEIILNQSETFKQGGGNLAGGKDALYYGMDGEWTAHTVYVTKSDGTLTVKGVSRDVLGSSDLTEDLKGKQWVYGGMRMGGRSYYALDLTDINSPKVKFHIDPSSGKVYSLNSPEGKAYDALSNMGQSWSKPTLGYVNWKGKRKLVMIVGGGYDAGGDDGDGLKANNIRTGYAGYEQYNYKQEDATSSNKNIGAGVYMFDADTGDLLWHADKTSNANLKYSVVSQIRAIDRNNDGIIDHLYFGDLAGQAFRVDLKNDGGANFTTQINRILNVHEEDDGTSPRFYTMPAFTAHYSAGSSAIFGGNTVVVTFVSGNQSSPLLATTDSPQKKNSLGLKYDAAYAIFDYDVYPSTAAGRYPSTRFVTRNKLAAKDEAAGLAKLRYINEATTATTIDETSGWGGWYYQFDTKIDGKTKKEASVIKGLTTPLALEGSLYVTQYDASDNGTTSSCGAGVKGHSFTQRLCLPGGVCKDGAKYIYNLGSGIVTPNVGSDDEDPNKRSLVVPDPEDICPPGQTCKPEGRETFLKTGGALRFIPNRWYERYTQ